MTHKTPREKPGGWRKRKAEKFFTFLGLTFRFLDLRKYGSTGNLPGAFGLVLTDFCFFVNPHFLGRNGI